MSKFECPVVRVSIEPHPNADAIEIARIGDYQSIVKKGQIKDGDLAVYLPEQAVLPKWLLVTLGFWNELNGIGTLNGSAKNRIKAIKLRGILSQGVILTGEQIDEAKIKCFAPIEGQPGHSGETFHEGDNLSEFLGVTKYEPAIPQQLSGRALGANLDITHGYDFENIKKNPQLFDDGELVVMTEKVHGTLLQVIVVPESMANPKYYQGRVAITSKGLGRSGIILDHEDEAGVYAKIARDGLMDKMLRLFDAVSIVESYSNKPIVLFGEVFGVGVQDLSYGSGLSFRAFDICSGVRASAEFMPFDTFANACELVGISTVPVLYVGPFSKETMLSFTNGKETISGREAHVREGVVVKTSLCDSDGKELRHPRYGRKIAKSVSEAYLLRKGETTEFQ
jgi:RNA ligase (TIGR02306 family)